MLLAHGPKTKFRQFVNECHGRNTIGSVFKCCRLLFAYNSNSWQNASEAKKFASVFYALFSSSPKLAKIWQNVSSRVSTFLLWLCCSKVPAFLNVVDIAGLVKGASEGQGLGNAFLSHIKACDAMFHLCRKYNINFLENSNWKFLFFNKDAHGQRAPLSVILVVISMKIEWSSWLMFYLYLVFSHNPLIICRLLVKASLVLRFCQHIWPLLLPLTPAALTSKFNRQRRGYLLPFVIKPKSQGM